MQSDVFVAQVEVILARDGPNVITAPLEPPTWVRFSKNLFGGFSLLLWLGALLAFAHYSIETGIQAEADSENLVLGKAAVVHCTKLLKSGLRLQFRLLLHLTYIGIVGAGAIIKLRLCNRVKIINYLK